MKIPQFTLHFLSFSWSQEKIDHKKDEKFSKKIKFYIKFLTNLLKNEPKPVFLIYPQFISDN